MPLHLYASSEWLMILLRRRPKAGWNVSKSLPLPLSSLPRFDPRLLTILKGKGKEALPGESRRRRRSDQSRLRRCAGLLRQRQACVAHLHSRRDPSPRRRTHGRRSYRQQSRRRRRRRRYTYVVALAAVVAAAVAVAVAAVALGRLSTSLSLSLQSIMAVAARLPPALPRSCCS